MRGKSLLVFNPEHDFALAIGTGTYTPPSEVVKLKKDLSLLPALYACDSDFILLPDNLDISEIESLPYYPNTLKKDIKFVYPSDLIDLQDEISDIKPWGWDHAIARQLSEAGISSHLIPGEKRLEKIRQLSHRRTTIPFLQNLSEQLNINKRLFPKELLTLAEVEKFLHDHPRSFFKAPWSSSGRGIVVSDHISRKGLMEWIHGIIRRQGSVIAEPAWEKQLDFATEWLIKDGIPEFRGLSVFEASSRGKYHHNLIFPQYELRSIIERNTFGFSDKIIEAQQNAISEMIAPHYNGPMGIDMLADCEGNINPCVEINLRYTMGYILLDNDAEFSEK